MVHGMATGFTPTGTSSYVADIAPADRRGEALGLQTLIANIGSAYGQSLGSTLTNEYSIEVMFYVSSASALLSVLILLGLKETLPKPQPFSFKLMKLDRHEIFEPRVLFICVIMMLALFCFGLNLTLIPDFSEHLGMDNKGYFFSLLTLASIITRLLGGKASDKWGRPVVTLLATVGLVIAMLYISFVETEDELLMAGFIFGIAHGMVGPTLFAWGIDRAKEGHLGRALATIYIALELGVLLGAVVGGAIYANDIANFQMAYWVAAGLNMIGVIMSIGYNIKKRL
jgi:MFS family permease